VKSPVLTIARHEFILNRRNRWITSFAGLFAALTFLVAYFGMVTSGYAGFQDFTRTAASIVNLAGFVIPLFALLLGVFSFVSNREYIDLIVTQPVSRHQVLLGKYLGLLLTIVGASLIGFGIPGIIISLTIGVEGALAYGLVIALAMMNGAVFLGIAVLIALVTQRQQIALGAAVGIWLFFELFYGLLVIGSTLYFSHAVLKSMLLVGLMGNPIDLSRVLSLLAIGGPHFFGPAGTTLVKAAGSGFLAGMWGWLALIAWIVIPGLISLRIFSRQNL
jgi:Cu-processing system permease protein